MENLATGSIGKRSAIAILRGIIYLVSDIVSIIVRRILVIHQHIALQCCCHIVSIGSLGESCHRSISIGVDLITIKSPGVARTLVGIGIAGIQLQIFAILLCKLCVVAAQVIVVGNTVLAVIINCCRRSANHNLAAVRQGDVSALICIAHQISFHGVECHLSSLFTGQNLGQGNLFHIIVQIALDSQGSRVDSPAIAFQLFDLGVVTHSHQAHLGKCQAGQLAGGVELAVVTGQDALLGAPCNGACAPAAGGHVGIGSHGGGQLVSFLLAHHHVGDDLSSHFTSQRGFGSKVVALNAVEHAGSDHDVHCLVVLDFIVIFEVTCVRGEGDGHQAESHGQGQHQGQNLFQILHWVVPPFWLFCTQK